ncbi:MAG: hypothetical protein DDT22_00691 [candidate division WS2 bacterium]|nr:hypothetical protein [Candidatus Lithacetigena glycinireducens]MBT9175017.1 hypothetical protein [Candidatus Lithacetigena glycinireducens]
MGLENITVNTATIFTVATVVCIALAAIWPVRKIVRLLNRS